jgi:hypothetical protein
MTQKEILESPNLSLEEKLRVEEFYKAMEKFKWTEYKDKFAKCSTIEEVQAIIAEQQVNYGKRKQQEAKSYAKYHEWKQKKDKLDKLVKEAEKYGFTIDRIIEVVSNMYKEEHNRELQAKIAELQAKLL